jgi:hypothetical protein
MKAWQQALAVIYSSLFFLGPSLFALWMLSTSTVAPGTVRMYLLSMCLGAAMATIHSLASLSAHAGRGDLQASWFLFYFCRPFMGAGMALVTCLILVSGIGGFVVDPVQKETTLLAWSALAGLYSQPALDKLRDLFATLFGNRKAPIKEATTGKSSEESSQE